MNIEDKKKIAENMQLMQLYKKLHYEACQLVYNNDFFKNCDAIVKSKLVDNIILSNWNYDFNLLDLCKKIYMSTCRKLKRLNHYTSIMLNYYPCYFLTLGFHKKQDLKPDTMRKYLTRLFNNFNIKYYIANFDINPFTHIYKDSSGIEKESQALLHLHAIISSEKLNDNILKNMAIEWRKIAKSNFNYEFIKNIKDSSKPLSHYIEKISFHAVKVDINKRLIYSRQMKDLIKLKHFDKIAVDLFGFDNLRIDF